MLNPDEDARLVEACLRGDERAWDSLVRRHERLVYAVGRSYRLSDADMADVFQEVFKALFQGLPRLKEARALVRWLSSTTDRIARATALRIRREDTRFSRDPQDLESLPSAGGEPSQSLENLESHAMMRLAMAGLPDRCQQLLMLLYYQDPPLSYGQISKTIGIPAGSLGPTRARCFEKLRSILMGLESSPGGIRSTSIPTSPGEGSMDGSSGSRSARRPAGKRS